MNHRNRRTFRPFFKVFAGSLVFAGYGLAMAQQDPPQDPSTPDTAETVLPIEPDELQARIDRLSDPAPADGSVQAQQLAIYLNAQERLAALQEHLANLESYRRDIEEAPERIRSIQQELEQAPPPVDVSLAEDAELAEAIQQQAAYERNVQLARQALAELQAESNLRSERRREIPDQTALARQRLSEIVAEAARPAPDGEPVELTEAKRLLNTLRRRNRETELRVLEFEQVSYEARNALLTARVDLARRELGQAEERLRKFEPLVERARRSDAEKVRRWAEEAPAIAKNAPAQIEEEAGQIASDITEMADLYLGPNGLFTQRRAAEQRLDELQAENQALQAQFTEIKRKVEAAGQNTSVGYLLRHQMMAMPDVARLKRNVLTRSRTLPDLEIARIELEDTRSEIGDVASIVQQRVEALEGEIPADAVPEVETALTNLLSRKRDTVQALLENYRTYIDLIFDLNNEAELLIATAEEVDEFVGTRVLWIRSGPPLSLATIRDAAEPVGWLLSPANWRALGAACWSEVQRRPVASGLMALIFAGLVAARRRTRAKLAETGRRASKSNVTHYFPTVEALGATIILGAVLPALFFLIAIHLNTNVFTDAFGRAVGSGAAMTGIVLSGLELLRQTLRNDGLGGGHFGWAKGPSSSIRRHLGWYEIVTAVAVFVLATVQASGDDSWNESLGRLVFIAWMIGSFVLLLLLFQKSTSPVPKLVQGGRGRDRGPFFRWGRLVLIVVPLAFGIFAALGFGYTATRLSRLLFQTIVLVGALILLRALVLRWLLLARRRIAMDQARKKREALKKKDGESEGEIPEDTVDLTAVNEQSDRLLRSVLLVGFLIGVWFIWADVITAFNVLDRVQIGSTTETVTSFDGDGAVSETEVSKPITLKHLAVSLLIVFVTIGAVRNIPGLLEITILQRLNVAGGERHAIKTIVRYSLTILGGILAFNAVGIGWSKVQWLVAALGFGLGFGLQEIFANFISGIILLFERPIRVGDTVTVNQVHGTVSKIRIRATTIIDFDRKELVVPNKTFVTSELINWTLSDSILRAVVPVGIAYGSDTELAVKTLHQVTSESPYALSDPKPQVFFLGFGDSSLNFEVRAYCNSIETYLPLMHDLHMRIDRSFREADIEIAFPQRDIHIRSIEDALPIESRSLARHEEEAMVRPDDFR